MFENLKGLLFKETVWINTLRSMCAGLVYMILMLIAQPGGMPLYIPLLYPVLFPIAWLLFYIVSQILRIIKLGGIGSFMCMLASVPGDPLVYLLAKIKPALVPVKDFKFINFAPIILVFKDDVSIPETININDENKNETGKCPYSGRIIGDKEDSVMGFQWSTKGTIFTIDDDWNVKSNGKEIGFVDKIGQIRKGLKGDPNSTLPVGEEVIGIIKNGVFYINNTKVGELVQW